MEPQLGNFKEGEKLCVATFNVLANALATQDQFPMVSQEYLSLPERRSMIIQEIMRFHLDLICVQEVDFIEEIMDFLNAKDREYGFIYGKKPNGAGDGLAIIYRLSRLRLVESEQFPLSPTDPSRNQIGLMGVFLINNSPPSNTTPDCICVYNVHLKAKPEFEDIRTAQIATVLTRSTRAPTTLIMGDLNSLPGTTTNNLVCKFDYHNLFESKTEAIRSDGEPRYYTTYKVRDDVTSRRVSDFIYCKGLFGVTALTSTPSSRGISNFGSGLPSHEYPSDHLLQGAEIVIHKE